MVRSNDENTHHVLKLHHSVFRIFAATKRKFFVKAAANSFLAIIELIFGCVDLIFFISSFGEEILKFKIENFRSIPTISHGWSSPSSLIDSSMALTATF